LHTGKERTVPMLNASGQLLARARIALVALDGTFATRSITLRKARPSRQDVLFCLR
jgi:hypothetical protein